MNEDNLSTGDFKEPKKRFHDVLGKDKEDIWSIKKIVKILNVMKDVLFEDTFQKFKYKVIRGKMKS